MARVDLGPEQNSLADARGRGMKTRSEKLLLWLIVLLPTLSGLTILYIMQWYFADRLAFRALWDGGYFELFFAAVAGVFPVTLLSAFWIRNVLKRYREQISVREDALRTFNATIEDRVREEAAKRHRHEKMLIQHAKMTAMDEMATLVTYHLEPPLQQLEAALVSAQEQAPDVQKHELEPKMKAAEAAIRTMKLNLEDLRESFFPDAAREATDPSEVLSRTMHLIEKRLRADGISVDVHFECSVTLPLYRNALMQVMLAVIQNAREALTARSVALPRIEIECYETGQFIVIRICDNAGGVDEGVMDRIFEPFFSTNESGKGAGLGLYMARNIVEEYFSGELMCDNIGDGACFYIKIGKHQEEVL
jgi:two-component system, NtrC family, C4-dicarboxylate transport sensor histidine kinase DctB